MDADRENLMRELLHQLADMLGDPLATNWMEHDRWRLYQKASAVPDAHELLQRLAQIEPVPSMASAVVVLLIERSDRSHRQELVNLLDSSVRAFPERRVRELEVLESINDPECYGRINAEAVRAWSDWLQMKVIGLARRERVLELLAVHGRTKKIRRAAREALTQHS